MTTHIESFDELVLGKNHPAVLHIERDNADETIKATFYIFDSYKKNGQNMNGTRAELRQKGKEIALFLYNFPDVVLDDWWKDSEVVWSIG